MALKTLRHYYPLHDQNIKWDSVYGDQFDTKGGFFSDLMSPNLNINTDPLSVENIFPDPTFIKGESIITSYQPLSTDMEVWTDNNRLYLKRTTSGTGVPYVTINLSVSSYSYYEVSLILNSSIANGGIVRIGGSSFEDFTHLNSNITIGDNYINGRFMTGPETTTTFLVGVYLNATISIRNVIVRKIPKTFVTSYDGAKNLCTNPEFRGTYVSNIPPNYAALNLINAFSTSKFIWQRSASNPGGTYAGLLFSGNGTSHNSTSSKYFKARFSVRKIGTTPIRVRLLFKDGADNLVDSYTEDFNIISTGYNDIHTVEIFQDTVIDHGQSGFEFSTDDSSNPVIRMFDITLTNFPSPYFNGDYDNCVWDGTAHNSFSTCNTNALIQNNIKFDVPFINKTVGFKTNVKFITGYIGSFFPRFWNVPNICRINLSLDSSNKYFQVYNKDNVQMLNHLLTNWNTNADYNEFVFTWDGNTFTLYCNGQLEIASSGPGFMQSIVTTDDWRLNTSTSSPTLATRSFYDFFVADGLLSASEVLKLYNEGVYSIYSTEQEVNR